MKKIMLEIQEFRVGTSDNDWCSNAQNCCDCTYRKSDEERESCRSSRMRLLTEEEQDDAVAFMLKEYKGDVKLSSQTRKFMSYDGLCVAQDKKTRNQTLNDVADVLAKKDWFGEKMTANEKLVVLNFIRNGMERRV